MTNSVTENTKRSLHLPLSVILLWSLIILGNLSIIVPFMWVYGLTNAFMYPLFIFQGFASAIIIIYSTDLRKVVKEDGKYTRNFAAKHSAEISLLIILLLRSAELYWFSDEYIGVLPSSSMLLFQFANIVMFICEWYMSHLKGNVKNPFKDLYEGLRPKHDKLLNQFYTMSNNLLQMQEELEKGETKDSEIKVLNRLLNSHKVLLTAIQEQDGHSVTMSGKIYTVCPKSSCQRITVSARATRTVSCACGSDIQIKPSKAKALA